MERLSSTETFPTPGSAITHEEICENATILDEGIRLCPLCASEVRLFFINLNEKILMCENVECEYPFGHESIVYVKEDNEVQSDEEVVSIRSRTMKGSPGATLSVVSTSAWSDIDKINRLYDAEEQFDHRPETREYYTHRKKISRNPENEEDNVKILEKVNDIKKLNEELVNTDDEPFAKPKIKNEKWIRNLMSKQKESGISLLGPEEMKLFNTKQPDIGLGELKIDIDIGNQCDMSSVKIEITSSKEKQA